MPHLFSPASSHWISLEGPDARDFLHRLTTADARNLEAGRGSGAFFLNAQGKVRAWFTLWCYGPQEFAFEIEGAEWKKRLLEAIDQYTFAERMTLSDVTALSCAWIFPDSSAGPEIPGLQGLEAFQTAAIDEEIRLCHHGDRQFGRAWISAWGRPERLRQWAERALPGAERATAERLEAWRIQANRPAPDREITEASIPLEAGLIDSIAQAKGCYPGQEVIERILSLGSPARRLCRLEGSGPAPRAGESLHNLAEPSAEVGEVTSAIADKSGFIALAYVRKIHAKEGLEIRVGSGETGARTVARITQVAPYA